MTLKITEKSIHSETTLKSFTKDNHMGFFVLITLKSACFCYNHYDSIENFQRYSYPLYSIFSVTLVFQCDFQCHILTVKKTLSNNKSIFRFRESVNVSSLVMYSFVLYVYTHWSLI